MDATDSSLPPNNNESSYSYARSGIIMLASVLILFAVVMIILYLHSFCKYFFTNPHRQSMAHRHEFQPTTEVVAETQMEKQGLGVSVLKTLPVFIYKPKTDQQLPPECAVCLSEFIAGEKGRLLPNCGHKFHTECIDTWFGFHSNCPLCRSPVKPHLPKPVTLRGPGSPGSGRSGVEPGGYNSSPKKSISLNYLMEMESIVVEEVPVRDPTKLRGKGVLSLKRIWSI